MAFKDDFTGVQHVGVPSKDLEATIKFYQSLGFEKIGPFPFENNTKHCVFLRFGNLTIETWDNDPVPMKIGAINHFALNTPNIEQAFADAKKENLHVLNDEIQHIPTFWDHGIKYFNIQGPNMETIEVCQIL